MPLIRLLGPPVIEKPGRQPRGKKAWGLLGYVLLAERPPSRRRLAELFFADAEDPLGALRWTLAELRRAIGVPEVLTGDPVSAGLDATTVDVLQLDDLLLTSSGELLEGVELESCPEFESWLLVERRRVAGAIEARLRQHAIALLATGQAADAIPVRGQGGCRPSARAGQSRTARPQPGAVGRRGRRTAPDHVV